MAKDKDKSKAKGKAKSFQRDYNRDPNATPLSAEEIRNKFGLTYNEDHVGGSKTHPNGSNNETGAIYNRETGEYIGSLSNFKDADYSQFENMRSFAKDSGLLMKDVNGMDSLNDVATMASQMNMGGKAESSGPAEKPQYEMSPEYAEAKARVQQYTEDVTSGRTAKELFGEAPDKTSFLDRYKLKLGERLPNGNYLEKQAAPKTEPDPTEAFLADK